ncbi:MAG TPA: T9SS type B sorting domain-containing protein [Bacteroidetes bacterium]|nr:T9SS type B sorting domain-containing protein [Bacteroidota bacterium]
MMQANRLNILLFILAAMAGQLPAQVEYSLQLQPGGSTFTAYARPQVDYLPPLDNLVQSASLTIVAPANSLQASNLQSHLGQWELSHFIEQPAENPGADYFIFKLIGATADTAFLQGQPVPLFSFQNAGNCLGAFELMDMDADPFFNFNASGSQAAQSFEIYGAGGEAYLGNYATGQADCARFLDCQIAFSLQLLPSGFYEIKLIADGQLPANTAILSLQTTLKVPTNFFQLHQLANLQPGGLSFAGVARFDAPLEAPGFDYIRIKLEGSGGNALPIGPSTELPLLRFANGGSCQGDSIFLVKNTGDAFLPPNSQNATVGQRISLENGGGPQAVCVSGTGAAACLGCQFLQNIISVNGVSTAGPVACLGLQNGSVNISATGADDLLYSLDGGQVWQSEALFDSLPAGIYQPMIKGSHLGCEVQETLAPIDLQEETQIDLQINIPEKTCAGSDLALQITAPVSMPPAAVYQWSGPLGFSADFADPVIFAATPFHSGSYSLTVDVPGCDEATASANADVVEPAPTPVLRSNSPICESEILMLTTDGEGQQYQWIGPAGQSDDLLALPGLTTSGDTTFIAAGHPAYLGGNWKIRMTDLNGCTVESPENEVEIKQRPQAFASNNGPVCLGKDAQLSANQLTGAVYRWRREGEQDVFSFSPQPMLQNVTAEQTFYLQIEMDGCTSENMAMTTVALHPKPASFPTYEYQPAADCSPQDIQLEANGSGLGLLYEWSGANNFASQIENPVIPNAGAQSNGSYQLKVTNVHGCTAVSPFEISGVVDAVATPIVQSSGAVCPGGDILLSANGYDNFQTSYQWFKNGNPIYGATSDQLNIDAVESSDAGMYSLQVQVGDCEIASAGLLVEVLESPEADPSFVLTHPCEGASLQFFANYAGIATWHWEGPNGFVSNAQNPLIFNTEFDDLGAYSLTVTGDNGCTATGSVLIDGILPVPDAPQVASNSPVCPEDEIVLVVQNPTNLGTVFYDWTNGMGEHVGLGGPTLSLATDDPQAVPPFLVKKNVNGCDSELSEPVPVEVKPLPVADAQNSGATCPGDTVQLFAAPSANAAFTWRIAGQDQVLSFAQNTQLAISDTTIFELTVQANGCQSRAIDSTVVFTKKRPVISDVLGGGSHCEGTAVQLFGLNETDLEGSVFYEWTRPDGFTFSGIDSSGGQFLLDLGALQPADEGTYTLQLESAEGCFSTPRSVLVDYVEMPDAPVISTNGNTICESETLQLDASPYSGNNVQYEWYFSDGNNDELLGTSASSTFFIDNITPSQSGFYFVNASVDGCQPPPSNQEQVSVLAVGANVAAGNSTGATSPICEGGEVHLEATLIPGAAYQWTGPSGFQASSNNPTVPGVDISQSGNYFVEISIPGCSHVLTDSTAVFIKPAAVQPQLSAPPEACEGEDVVFEISNPEAGADYKLYFSQNNFLIAAGTNPTFTLQQIQPAQSGGYFVLASLNGCPSPASDMLALQVSPPEVVQAFAGGDQIVCDENELTVLRANEPTVGTGFWTSIDEAIPFQADRATTTAQALQPGANRFVWHIHHDVCGYQSTDTTSVFLEKIMAEDDAVAMDLSDTVSVFNVLENDGTTVADGWDVFIFNRPKKGAVGIDVDGLATYRPYPNVFGDDDFVYQICSMTCPDVCSKASAKILIGGQNVAAGDCFVPNMISPNGDGENDEFTIPCAAVYPGSSLVVYNRYGSQVYESRDYQNDWQGSYDGAPLPVGTYFYQLSLNDGEGTVLQGYVAVMR